MQKHEKKREKGVPFLAFTIKCCIFGDKIGNNLMKLSVIVPVYNVEKNLPRCLDSFLWQGMEAGEWEVICVNDGSPDNCGAILAEYEAKHPCVFKVITQENLGLCVARNTGMQIAKGEWIAFVDSDDYLVDNGYRYLIDHYCSPEVDVVAFENHYLYTDGVDRKFADVPLEGKILYEGDGVEGQNQFEMPHVWSKLYRRTFLQENDIKFMDIYLEDLLFNFQVFRCQPHLIYTDCKAYGYEKNNGGSLMRQAKKGIVLKQLNGLLFGVEYMNDYLSGTETDLMTAAHRCVNIYLDHFYRKAFRVRLTWGEWRKLFGRLRKQPIHRTTTLRGNSGAYKRVAMLRNCSSHSYLAYLLISTLYRKILYKTV